MNKGKLLIFLLLMFLGVNSVLAQSTITGKVTGDDGQPVIGATVQIKGTTLGTISGVDGSFSLNVPQNNVNDSIQFSFIGMTTVVEAIGGRTNINVVLSSDDVAMDEVVVTALGLSKDHKAIGYSALQVSADEIMEAKTSNPVAAISGKVAGVEIMGNAGPGSSQSVMIRGAASLSQNQPLYIVDGIPLLNSQKRTGDDLNFNTDMGTGINAVNPNDIASMTVLKGAAATALYGSRATNGVILITTKSGANTNGKMNLTYDGTLTLQRLGYVTKSQELFGQGWDGDVSREENGNWGPAYTNQNQVWGYAIDGKQQMANYGFLEDRVRDFYEIGVGNSHTLSASGGNASTNYYVSLGNDKENGIVPGDHDTYNRTTISTRASHKWNRLTLQSGISFSLEKTVAIPSGQGESMGRSIWNAPNNISLVDLADLSSPYNTNSYYYCLFGYNPYYIIENFNAEMRKNKFRGNVQADLQILKDLKLTYRFGGDVENYKTESWRNVIKFEEGSPQWDYDVNQSGNSGIPYSGYYEIEKRTEYEINHDAFLTYTKSINDKLGLSAIAGLNVMETSYNYGNNYVNDLVMADFYSLTNSSADPITEYETEKVRRLGLFANVDLDYNRMLYVTLTCRNDWSSTLPTTDNSYTYPGITLSWVFTELGDDGKLGPLTFGKLRASYGWTGKDAMAYYVYNYYTKSGAYNYGYNKVSDMTFPFSSTSSWSVSNLMGNENLKPELTNEFEFGAELVFYDGRLSFDGDYYNKFTKNLISTQYLDNSMGYTQYLSNIGDVRNQGYEMVLSGIPVKTKDFQWKVSANFSQNFNKVERLELEEIFLAGFSTAGIYAVEGKSLGQYKASVNEKVSYNGTEYSLVNAKGYPVESDEVYLDKDVNEKFRAGFTNRFTYKNFSLEATLDLHYGGYFYCGTKDYLGWTGSGYETAYNDRNPFIIPNSVVACDATADGAFEVDGAYYKENTKSIATGNSNLAYFYSYGGFNCTDGMILDRSYFKLRNVSFAYSLPKSVIGKLKLQDVRLSFNAANILLWTPAENCYVDPECTTFGTGVEGKFGEFMTNPTNQVFTFGLSVKF